MIKARPALKMTNRLHTIHRENWLVINPLLFVNSDIHRLNSLIHVENRIGVLYYLVDIFRVMSIKHLKNWFIRPLRCAFCCGISITVNSYGSRY